MEIIHQDLIYLPMVALAAMNTVAANLSNMAYG